MTDLDKGLFTFASYNAGPNKIRSLRQEAQKRGLNPNVWFNNVERVVSEKVGRETVTYVNNIYKYYISYKLIVEEQQEREKIKKSQRINVLKHFHDFDLRSWSKVSIRPPVRIRKYRHLPSRKGIDGHPLIYRTARTPSFWRNDREAI